MSTTLQSQNLMTAPRQQILPRPCADTWSWKVFSFCLLVIACVSIYDTYLVVLYRETILLDERNPLCEYLIRQDTVQLSWFILGKLVGNLAVIGTLLGLFFFRFRRVLTVAKGVACFQLMLLAYLQLSDKTSGVLHFDGFWSPSQMEFRNSVVSAIVHIGVVVPTLVGGVFVKRKWDSRRA